MPSLCRLTACCALILCADVSYVDVNATTSTADGFNAVQCVVTISNRASSRLDDLIVPELDDGCQGAMLWPGQTINCAVTR
jgi:hypothetical protein